MGFHPMLTENANFVNNALRGDLITVNVRPWCGHHTSSVHQCFENWIIPQFDPRMSSLALLEVEIPSPLYVTCKKCRCYFWCWWCSGFPGVPLENFSSIGTGALFKFHWSSTGELEVRWSSWRCSWTLLSCATARGMSRSPNSWTEKLFFPSAMRFHLSH